MESESSKFILNPEVIWIDGRCYRKLPIKGEQADPKRQGKTVNFKPVEDTMDDDDDDNLDLPIQFEKNRFWLRYPIPSALVRFVVGKSGNMRRQIEAETFTEIKIPSERQYVDCIVIIGEKKKPVVQAYRRIENIVHDARWKVGSYTHFLSIPMNSTEIQDSYLRFKESVLQNAKSHGVCEECFEEPAKLHLTITMLTLFDDREKETAKELLLQHRKEILEKLAGKPFRVEMKGIEYMNDDPAEVNVLYGKVKETDSDNCLQMIADKLADAFITKNYSQKEYEYVKLHVTLMKSRSGPDNKRTTFDARKILEKYENYRFGEMTISEIHVSVRYTGGKNYYTPSYVLKLED